MLRELHDLRACMLLAEGDAVEQPAERPVKHAGVLGVSRRCEGGYLRGEGGDRGRPAAKGWMERQKRRSGAPGGASSVASGYLLGPGFAFRRFPAPSAPKS
jgi:hypothetical protein